MKVMVKNGRVGTLVGNCSVIFDNFDGYSYSVPANDIVKVWNDKTVKKWENILEENNNIEELRTEILEYLEYMQSEDFEDDMNSNLEDI